MALKPMIVKIGVDAGKLTSGLNKAKGELDGFETRAKRVGKAIDNIADRATQLGKKMSAITAAVSTVGTGLLILTRNSAKSADAIGKAAQTAGIGAEAFQEMQFAVGQMAGTTDEQFGMAMQRVSRRLGEAASGNKAYADAFDQLGVSMEAVRSGALSQEQVIDQVVTGLEGMESAAAAAAAASKVFGEEVGPKIGAALRESRGEFGELRKDAAVLPQSMIDASADFNDATDRLTREFDVLRAQLSEKIIPLLVDKVIPIIIDKVIPAMSKWVDKIGEVADFFANLPGPVQEALGVLAIALGAGGPVLIALGVMTAAFKAALVATGPIGWFILAAGTAAAAWIKWGDDIKEAVGGAIDFIGEKFEAVKEWLQGIIEKAVEVKEAIVGAFTVGGPVADRPAAFNPITGEGHPSRRASGGPLRSGQASIVGENGPELIMPAGDSRVFSSSRTKQILSGDGDQPTLPDRAGGIIGGVHALGERIGEALTPITGEKRPTLMSTGGEGEPNAPDVPQPVTFNTLTGGGTPHRRASGGPLGSGQAAIFNENGAELIVPAGDSRVFSAPRTKQMMGDGGGGNTTLSGRSGGDGIIGGFQALGERIGAALAGGIGNSTSLVGDAMGGIGKEAVTESESAVSSILGSMSKLFKGSKGIALAQAAVNIGQGITEALKLPFPQSLAAAAKVAAEGASALSRIQSASPGSAGGGGSAGGVSAPRPTQNIQIDLVGATPQQADQYQIFADTLNESVRQGLLPNIVVATA